jgi:hypothetical protein
MTWKLYAVVSAGAFAATYLVSSPAKDVVRPVSSAASASASASAQRPIAASEIEQLADGLHVRLRTDSYRTPGRDLFRFQSRPAPAVVRPAPKPVVEPPAPPPPPPLPPLSLSGVAVDIVNGVPQRSAVLSAPSNVLIVREGESVAGLYKVLSIGDDSVELEAIADGSRRTLRFAK